MALKYLVTGASGQLGALVIEALLKTEAPGSVGALVRRPEAAAALEGAGLPGPVAAMLADSDRGASEGGLYSEDRTLSRLIGRPTTSWRETLRAGMRPEVAAG